MSCIPLVHIMLSELPTLQFCTCQSAVSKQPLPHAAALTCSPLSTARHRPASFAYGGNSKRIRNVRLRFNSGPQGQPL